MRLEFISVWGSDQDIRGSRLLVTRLSSSMSFAAAAATAALAAALARDGFLLVKDVSASQSLESSRTSPLLEDVAFGFAEEEGRGRDDSDMSQSERDSSPASPWWGAPSFSVSGLRCRC